MSATPLHPASWRLARSASVRLYLIDPHGTRVVCGRTEWIGEGGAYVVVPYGTATRAKQTWSAVVCSPGSEKSEGMMGREVVVELIAAEPRAKAAGLEEGLLLRFIGGTRDLRRARAVPDQGGEVYGELAGSNMYFQQE